MPDLADLIIEEYRDRYADAWTTFATYEEIASYLMPHSSNIITQVSPGTRMTQRIYDVTGIDALDKLRTTLTANMTPRSTKWFSMRSRESFMNRRSEVRAWYDDVERLMFDARNDSNFHNMNPRFMGDTAGMGTGAMMQTEVEEFANPDPTGAFRGLQYNYAPVGTYVLDEDGTGKPDMIIRDVRMRPLAMLHRWPGANHRNIVEAAGRTSIKPVRIFHATKPDYINQRWQSIYVDVDNRHVIAENFFRDFPWMISRWEQMYGEIYGRGRGFLALPEVITLNLARKQKLRYWAKTIDPPMQVLNRGVIGKTRLTASAMITVNQMDAIRPIETGSRFGGRFDHNAIPENESKMQIRQIFWTEQLMQFQREAKTPPTATEVVERLELLRQLVGPAIEGLQDQAYRPDLGRQFKLMMRAGALPQPPQVIQQLGTTIDFVFEGPFARAQKSTQLKSLNDALIIMGGLMAFDPEAADHFDVDMMAQDIPTLTDIPQRYARAPKLVQDRRAERVKRQRQLEQQQAGLVESQTAQQSGRAAESFASANAPAAVA